MEITERESIFRLSKSYISIFSPFCSVWYTRGSPLRFGIHIFSFQRHMTVAGICISLILCLLIYNQLL